MLESPRNIRVISFTTIRPRPPDSACLSCGADLCPEGVCRTCAPLLVDLALSDCLEDFPRVVEDPVEDKSGTSPALSLNYDHYEICVTADGFPWELGRGAMGLTYKAKDIRLGRCVALKLVNPAHFFGRDAKERFLREARTSAGLRHPNIASIFHLGLEDENCFYAMEYIQGETLEARIQRAGALSLETALEITAQVTRALRAAHQERFIHRDVKPSNIMLVEGDRSDGELLVKVIDFGLAKAVVSEPAAFDLPGSIYFAGTPKYASPEQLAGRVIDARSDIYSLGMCLDYMLSGDAAVASPEHLPVAVLGLVASMIAADPACRPPTAQALLEQIHFCQQSLRISARPHHRQFQRNLAVGSSIGVLVLVVTLALALRALAFHSTPMPTRNSPPNLDPVEARVCVERGNELFAKCNKADTQGAIECYLQATRLDPSSADAQAGLASAYLRTVSRFSASSSNIDLAVTSAQRAIALDPRSPAGFSALAAVRSWQHQHWEALDLLHHALELDPGYPAAIRSFSLLWCSAGQPHMALPWAKAAVRREPSNLMNWFGVCDAYVDLCEDEQAEQAYRHCLQINPAWTIAYCGLMRLHILERNFDQARQDYATVESIEPGLILPLTLKAQIDFFSGDYVAAESAYRQLLALRRDGYVNYFGGISYLSALGYLRCRAGSTAEGAALLEEAAGLHVADAQGSQAMYDLAAVRAIQGRKEDALGLLRQAISAGWVDFRSTRLDPRFETLHGEPSFEKLLDDLCGQVGRMRRRAGELCAKPLSIADYPVQANRDFQGH